MEITLPFSEIWFWVVLGVAGFWLVKTGRLVSLVIGLIGAAFIFYVALPFAQSLRSVEGIHEDAIHGESVAYARDAVRTIGEVNAPVREASRAGNIDTAAQGNALGNYGRVGRQQAENERRAVAELHGRLQGDYMVPANWAVDADDPGTWYTPPSIKQVCGPTILRGWNLANADRDLQHLNREVDGRGWFDREPRIRPDYNRLVPEAPFFAQLVRIGLHGQVRWDWQRVDDSGALVMEITSDSCQAIYFARNIHVSQGDRPPIRKLTEWRNATGGMEIKQEPGATQ